MPRALSLYASRALCFVAALTCAIPLATAAEPLRIAVSRSPLSLPLYIAEAKGYFKAEGAAVAVHECVGGHRCLKQVIQGGADLCTVSDLPVMFNSFTSRDYAVIGTFVTTKDDLKLIARTGANVRKIQDLAGKRVGIVANSSSHYFLDAFLIFHGVDPAAVEVVKRQPEQLPAALREGEVDAISIWEPYGYIAVAALGAGALTLPNPGVYTETFNLVAHRRLMPTHDAELAKLLKAIDRAVRFIKENPEEAQALVASRLSIDIQAVRWMWPHLKFRLDIDHALISTLESEARWALRRGHIVSDRAPNYLDYIYAAPLRALRGDTIGPLR